jgi:hypothetical protein
MLSTLAGGVRASTFGVFGQLLVGATRDSQSSDSAGHDSLTKFEFELDGGVATPIANRTSLVGEAGYRHVAEDPSLNNFRLLVGIRFNLGR